MLGEHARRFATDRLAPDFLERESTHGLERRPTRRVGEMGFIAPERPELHGGRLDAGGRRFQDADRALSSARGWMSIGSIRRRPCSTAARASVSTIVAMQRRDSCW